MNLDSSVGRTRVGYWRRVRVGATTQQATACKAEQHPRARRQWLNRVRSATTLINAQKVHVHRRLRVQMSGQLGNLG